jgi:hypothetical protein
MKWKSNIQCVMNTLSDIRQIIVIAVLVLYLKSMLGMRVKMFVNLPGTLLHEFSHFIVAVLFNGKPTSLSVLPEQMKDGNAEFAFSDRLLIGDCQRRQKGL